MSFSEFRVSFFGLLRKCFLCPFAFFIFVSVLFSIFVCPFADFAQFCECPFLNLCKSHSVVFLSAFPFSEPLHAFSNVSFVFWCAMLCFLHLPMHCFMLSACSPPSVAFWINSKFFKYTNKYLDIILLGLVL